MTNPASASDVTGRFHRDLTDREQTLVPVLLDDAWQMLLDRRTSLPDDITAGQIAERTVVRILCAMVARVLGNPEGLLEESVDDYRYRRDSAVSTGALYVSADELANITPDAEASRSSVRLTIYGDT